MRGFFCFSTQGQVRQTAIFEFNQPSFVVARMDVFGSIAAVNRDNTAREKFRNRRLPDLTLAYLILPNAKTNMTEISSHTRLQHHYDAMWDSASGAVFRGDIDCDTHLLAGQDERRGLTLIARPDPALCARFDAVLDRLAGVEPQQYRYPMADMHLTILSLATVADDLAPALLHLPAYHAAVREALDGMAPFDIDFRGITISRGAVLAQGFPCGPALETLRERLRDALRHSGIGAAPDQRYRLVTAHATLCRFVAPLQAPERFIALMRSLRHAPLGRMHVGDVELVTNDWYMSSDAVECITRIRLPTAKPLEA
jgi:2'-5' RNA ligase